MRDPKVFGRSEESLEEDAAELKLDIELDPVPENDERMEYGSTLSDIQNNDLAKCSQLVLGRGNLSQSKPLRRLSLELNQFLKDHPRYISVAPIRDNLFHLLGSIEGPPGTPYEKGIFFIRIDCPENYPFSPLVCNFMTPIHHPNISGGQIGVNILEDAWSPALTLQSTLLSICSMLSGPFFDSPLDETVAAEYFRDKIVYESNARLRTQEYAIGVRPSDEELEAAGEWNKRPAIALEGNRNVQGQGDKVERVAEARRDGLW